MASTGVKYAGTCVDDATVGTLTWGSVTNAQGAADNVYASLSGSGLSSFKDNSVKLVLSGSITGNDKATSTTLATTGGFDPPAAATWVNYGSATDLWGTTPSATDINASTTGLVFAGQRASNSAITHYIKATNFGNSIPTGSTIVGITAGVCNDYEAVSTSFAPGTRVRAPGGPVAIETISTGDTVYAFTKERKVVKRKVIGTRKRMYRGETVCILTDCRRVRATEDHRFFSVRGWVAAKEIRVGDWLYVWDAGWTKEQVTGLIRDTTPCTVHTLSVSGSPTFFAEGFAVHNISLGFTFIYVDAIRLTVEYVPAYTSSFMWRRML